MKKALCVSLIMVAGTVSAQQIHADAWSSDDVDKKRPPSMIVKRATLMAECRKEALMNERVCDDKLVEQDLQRVCRREVQIQQADCRNKKMCELKLGFLQTKCVDLFNYQAYGDDDMTKEKVIDVGKCFTRILRDHMKCKDRVSEATQIALKHMKTRLEKEIESELLETELENEHHLEDEKIIAEEARTEVKQIVVKVDESSIVEELVVAADVVELEKSEVEEQPEIKEAEPESVEEEVVKDEKHAVEDIAPLVRQENIREDQGNIKVALLEAEDDETDLEEDYYTSSESDA